MENVFHRADEFSLKADTVLRGLRRLARNRDFFFQFSDFFVRRNYSYQVLITHKNFHDHLSKYEGTDRQTDYFSSIDINFRDYVKKIRQKRKRNLMLCICEKYVSGGLVS